MQADQQNDVRAEAAARRPAMPVVADRAAWQAELDALRAREKAHTHEGDAIAAARRRLPMVEVDATTPLIGERGPVTLLDAFEGRRQLITYYFMWYPGQPPRRREDGARLRAAARPDRLRTPGDVGGLARRMAEAVGSRHRGAQSLLRERASDRPVAAARRRTLRRPRDCSLTTERKRKR